MRPFEFTKLWGDDSRLTMREAVGQAIGAASMTWGEPRPDAVFDDVAASDIVEKVLGFIEENACIGQPGDVPSRRADE